MYNTTEETERLCKIFTDYNVKYHIITKEEQNIEGFWGGNENCGLIKIFSGGTTVVIYPTNLYTYFRFKPRYRKNKNLFAHLKLSSNIVHHKGKWFRVP